MRPIFSNVQAKHEQGVKLSGGIVVCAGNQNTFCFAGGASLDGRGERDLDSTLSRGLLEWEGWFAMRELEAYLQA